MKKFLFFLLCILSLSIGAFFVDLAFGAGSSMTFVRTDVVTHTGERWIEFTVTCTADDTNGSFPDTQIPGDLKGYRLFSISTSPGGTAPTDDSDLTLNEGSVSGPDVLGGSGVDKIDNATDNFFKPLLGSDSVDMPIFDSLWMQIDNNIVNSAVSTVTIRLIQ